MRVTWGGNDLIDCVALLAWGDQVVLRVSSSPIRVDLKVPSAASDSGLEIQGNELITPTVSKARVVTTSEAVAVFWQSVAILMAQEIDANTVLLHTDFRALGVNIFDDAAGLHIGGSLLGGNTFSGCSTAIALG